MNTGKQINAMVVVLFLLLVVSGAYSVWDPFRSDDAEEEQLALAGERGAQTFALNCRLCHGDRGQGGAAAGRLPAALPLDIDRLRGISGGTFNQSAFDDAFKLVFDTITCGRVGTAMQLWGRVQGGPLNEEQVRQLAVLITEGRWELAQEHADEIDAEATRHASVQMPDGTFNADETELVVSNAGLLKAGQYVRIGIDGETEERMRILPERLVVERGVGGTEAAEHERAAAILRAQPAPGEDAETGETLGQAVGPDDTILEVNDTRGFAAGDLLLVGEERVRVVEVQTGGIPAAGQLLAQEIGKTRKTFFVSGAEGIEEGAIIRIDGELMEVTDVRDNSDPEIALEEAVAVSARRIAVSDPFFFGEDYLLRIDEELLRVERPVETGQLLGETIGRAETRFSVSGTVGISSGMVIRLERELLRVVELAPARVEVERGVDDTEAASHVGGTAILKVLDDAAQEDGEEPDTGQTLLEAAVADDTVITVSGTVGVVVGETYQLRDERVRVRDIEPARLRVERGVEGTERAEHSRRIEVFESNLLEVERGVGDTSAAAHAADGELLLTEVEVRRAVQGSEREDHAKNEEIYLGHRLIVERGVLGTEAADHANGELVRDFVFPGGPDNPSMLQQSCGQIARAAPPAAETPSGPTATPVAGAQVVAISLTEFSVTPDVPSVAAGPVQFEMSNDGTVTHNLRAIKTDLAPDALPVDAGTFMVDEGQVDVLAKGSNLSGGETGSVTADLAPGSYVLICNVPTHYEAGMTVAFEVTGP